MSNSRLEDKLNEILKHNIEAEKAFANVVGSLEHRGFQALMDKSISERIRFADELKSMMNELGIPVQQSEEVINFRHRPWTHFKEIFSTNNDSAMLDEAIRAETHALDFYETTMKDLALSERNMAILQNHVESLRQTKNDLEVLKNNVAATA